MTRKRFVRLCMAAGFDRNQSNEFADTARRLNAPYAIAFNAFRKACLFADFVIVCGAARMTCPEKVSYDTQEIH